MEKIHTAEYWIEHLGLTNHPEGGYFKEIYRSKEQISNDHLPQRYSSARAFGTSIYYLLRNDDFSAFHRILSDEIWTIIDGSSSEIFCIDEVGELEKIVLGKEAEKGEVPQAVISKNTWFGARIIEPNSFILVSCYVAPGFDFADFELAKREKLAALYPDHEDIVSALTR